MSIVDKENIVAFYDKDNICFILIKNDKENTFLFIRIRNDTDKICFF